MRRTDQDRLSIGALRIPSAHHRYRPGPRRFRSSGERLVSAHGRRSGSSAVRYRLAKVGTDPVQPTLNMWPTCPSTRRAFWRAILTDRDVTISAGGGRARQLDGQQCIDLMVEQAAAGEAPSSPQPPEAGARRARLYGVSSGAENRNRQTMPSNWCGTGLLKWGRIPSADLEHVATCP